VNRPGLTVNPGRFTPALCVKLEAPVTSYSGQPGPGDGWSIRSATGGDCSGT
jgi:hypothetical protein